MSLFITLLSLVYVPTETNTIDYVPENIEYCREVMHSARENTLNQDCSYLNY